MRKIFVGIFALLLASLAAAQTPMVATDITAAQVQAESEGYSFFRWRSHLDI